MEIKKTIYDWLEERFNAYIDLGCDEGADDPDEYAKEEMEFYLPTPADIIDDYIEEVVEVFNDDEFFVLNNRPEIDQAVVDWYKDRGYIK